MNHNGDLGLAEEMITSVAECGADAVKFQIFHAESFVTKDAMVYGEGRSGQPVTQIDMLKPYEFSLDQWERLKDFSEKKGLIFFASVLDDYSAELFASLEPPLFKIASCDLTNIPFIKKIASFTKPTFMSTGMSNMAEIDIAVRVFLEKGNDQLALLQCTSSYPARMEDAHVRAIPVLREAFGLTAGFSDHCKDNYASFASVALGASIVEKHFTTDNNLPGVDQEMSLAPDQFKDLVKGIRAVEAGLGNAQKKVLPSERAALENGRKSLVASTFISKGAVIESEMVAAKRPDKGISPIYYDLIIGRKARRDIHEDEYLTWESI
ncbi:MAG: N-acetylneuraminate synthase family protein [Deltaproteobacteria bacterium]|nr:N-acetylneuraminate synthase family protein [Deltaproteobacteria bacterium]